MPTIIHTLGENKSNWKMLQEMYEGGFLHGGCYIFARALHRGLGWPLVGLFVKKEGLKDHIDHAGVRSPDGRIFDARGFVSDEEFGMLFTSPPFDIREVKEDDLREQQLAVVIEYKIQCARDVAEILWPELPWKETRLSKIVTFADELEALCRKHKLWIRAPFPAQVPILAKGEDDEGGYELHPTIDGHGYLINCYLR